MPTKRLVRLPHPAMLLALLRGMAEFASLQAWRLRDRWPSRG